MRFNFAVLACVTLLSACGPRPVQIANDQCWNVKPGDSISGKLIIVGAIDKTLVEGGTYIQNTACPERTMGLAIPSGPMLDAYRMSMRTNPPRFVERQFFLTGRVSKNPGSDRLLVVADSLQPAP